MVVLVVDWLVSSSESESEELESESELEWCGDGACGDAVGRLRFFLLLLKSCMFLGFGAPRCVLPGSNFKGVWVGLVVLDKLPI